MKLLIKTRHSDHVNLLNDRHDKFYAKLGQTLGGKDLAFFASVSLTSTDSSWLAVFDGDYCSYAHASDDDKADVAEELEYLHTVVRGKLATDPFFSHIAKDLLKVPGQEKIFYCRDSSDKVHVTLAEWGCIPLRERPEFDPLPRIIAEPRKDRTYVEVLITWSDGEIAAKRPFWYFYGNNTHKKETTKDGKIPFGHKRNGTSFVIALTPDRTGHEETVEVVAGKNLYPLVFPYFTAADVKVIDQLDNPVVNGDIKVTHNGEEKVYNTGETGAFDIPQILYDKTPLKLTLVGDDSQTAEFFPEREENHFVFKIKRLITRNPHIRVINRKDGQLVPEYPLKINAGETEASLVSNSEGIVVLNPLELNTVFTVTDSNDPYNHKEFTVDVEGNEFDFPVDISVTFRPEITVVNRANGEVVGAYPLKIRKEATEQEYFTNRDGVVQLEETVEGAKLFVTDGRNAYNNTEYTVDSDNQAFTFLIDVEKEKTVRIKLLDIDKSIMPHHPMNVIVGEQVFSRTTDENGYVILPQSAFEHPSFKKRKMGIFKQKVRVEIPLSDVIKKKK
jgi:hypothetical protein